MKKYILPIISTFFLSVSALAQFTAGELNLKPKYSHSIHTNMLSAIPYFSKQSFGVGYSRFSSKSKRGFRYAASYVNSMSHESEVSGNVYNLKNNGGCIEGEWYVMSKKYSDRFIGLHYSMEVSKANWLLEQQDVSNFSYKDQSEISYLQKIHFVKQTRLANDFISIDIGFSAGYNFMSINDNDASETTEYFIQNKTFTLFGSDTYDYADKRDRVKILPGFNIFLRMGGTWKTNQKTK
jgi:hypothetical protein